MTLTQVSKIELPNKLKACTGKPNNIWVKQAAGITIQNALHCNKYHQKFGCARLTCADAQEYRTLTNEQNDFEVPTQPTEPNYDAATSAVAVTKLEADYDLKLSKYQYFQSVDQALVQQYIDTVPCLLYTSPSPRD